MDEMKAIEQIFAEPKADAEVAASGRARLLRLAAGGEPPATRRPLSRWTSGPRTRWVLGAGLLPVAAAGVAAVMLAGHGSAPASSSSGGQARRILLAAATKTMAAPANGRYYRFVTEEGQQLTVGSKAHPYRVVTRTVDEEWYAMAPGEPGRILRRDEGARPVSPADAAAWRAAGSPAQVKQVCDENKIVGTRGGKQRPDGTFEEIPIRQKCLRINMRPVLLSSSPMIGGPGMHGQPPVGLDLAKLSDDTATLRRQLLAWTRSGGLDGPVEGDSAQLWAAADYLIASPIGPVRPALRAAAYRVLADLPDVRSLGEVTDQRGRRGQALARVSRGSEGVAPGTNRLVIAPGTGVPLEISSNGGATEYRLVLECGYTNESPPPTRK
ncbi:CU044_5270 family protein [Actinomadura harenae]|uniref:Uncharacterized protein n=1 Tax=Actinomadura harenae TaxID=2483351 RepID=A0A3M2LZ95_9ACTN|nr:CU044_5270 family protein [Actinomadura harenae]RMI42462.1 hypothetical protein EBO15_19750 [Actinomadura harenae]